MMAMSMILSLFEEGRGKEQYLLPPRVCEKETLKSGKNMK
jgi:hypothetical protein